MVQPGRECPLCAKTAIRSPSASAKPSISQGESGQDIAGDNRHILLAIDRIGDRRIDDRAAQIGLCPAPFEMVLPEVWF